MGFKAHIIKILIRVIVGLFVLLLISGGLNLVQFLQPKGRLTCTSFGSYWDMQSYSDSFKKQFGYTPKFLDRDGNDIPCENTYYIDRPGKIKK